MRGVDLNWAGAERTFLLDIDLLRALEEKCDAGPAWILRRLSTDQWRINDVVDTIRFGLEGGGMEKSKARALVDAHFREHPLSLSVLIAKLVLAHALHGADEDAPQGEAEAVVE